MISIITRHVKFKDKLNFQITQDTVQGDVLM